MSNMTLPGADQPDTDRSPTILASIITMTLLSLVTVCGRVFVRLRMVRSFGTDDWLIVAAMVMGLAGMITVCIEVACGAGRHAAYLNIPDSMMGLELNFISQLIYVWGIPLVKLSVGFFLLRIASKKIYVRILQGTMTFLVLYTFFGFMALILQCKDLATLWDPEVQTLCWAPETLRTLGYINSTVNIVTDFIFAILPIPMLRNVRINFRTKVSIVCIMGLGVFVCGAAIIKACYLENYDVTGDVLWDSADLTIWTSAELATGIIAACLPCLKPLFKRILESTRHGSAPTKHFDCKLRADHPITGLRAKSGAVLGTRKTGSQSKRPLRGDLSGSESDEDILSDTSMKTLEITKTTFVSIDRTDAISVEEKEIGARRLSCFLE